ncbi:sensor histidine kinase [Actinotalea solisilvae]|uniref:sensor histidine kinase n=1 Tax=Actinotalea solisilvae TaxID=2072922 RepID=UPI0018F137DB|nr:sensor domain-containing protein [Actinotalea solisilvae]
MTSAAGPHDDVRAVAPALRGGRALLLAPVSAATWRAVSHAVVGTVVLLPVAAVVLTAVPLSLALVVLGVGAPMLVLVLLASAPVAALERARLRAQLGVDIAPPELPRRDLGARRWWRGWGRVAADPRRWGHLLHVVVGLGLSVAQLGAVAALGGGGLALLALPAYRSWADVDLPAALLVAVGLAAVWLAALLAQLVTLGHVRLARGLLGRPASAALADAARAAALEADERATRAEVRAEHLTRARARAVGAAADDRRRIERDLHDGAQQRLVALGVELGVARRAAASDPAVAAAALDHAHREVKETLAELRDLVRGIHPAVLTDRGLDAALSALAARCPVPVTVEVPATDSLDGAGPAAEAAAYFVTAEALTNVARHSGAQRADVRAELVGDRLRLTVSDDGRGGARALPGSGLDGLRGRVEALDGTFALDSPRGRGTRLTVEVPCAS